MCIRLSRFFRVECCGQKTENYNGCLIYFWASPTIVSVRFYVELTQLTHCRADWKRETSRASPAFSFHSLCEQLVFSNREFRASSSRDESNRGRMIKNKNRDNSLAAKHTTFHPFIRSSYLKETISGLDWWQFLQAHTLAGIEWR